MSADVTDLEPAGDDLGDDASLLCQVMANARGGHRKTNAWPPMNSMIAQHALDISHDAAELARAAFTATYGTYKPYLIDTCWWESSCAAWAEAESLIRTGWRPGMEIVLGEDDDEDSDDGSESEAA